MNKSLKQKEKWYWIVVAAIELVLFISSSMTYKQQTSVPFLERHLGSSKPMLGFFNQIGFNYGGKFQSIKNDGYYNFVEFFIRKGAHFGTYFLLGLFLCLALYTYFYKNNFLKIFVPWMAATGLAAFDEFHQGLTGGRSPLVADVILDSFGALVAILITVLVVFLIKKHNKKRHPFSMEY
ncbi:VanZ family protein [Companilactobacillus mishanensis]|uniref:VanZ family protein n=1 Tax=Companilactobacillus mishanensis TaxID=2486008 RepID=A0ABW9P7W7_9LACO|nr:VanZ family protein [Companilactobacillus mishanensis]MQS45364.1 VanZ family protein [Companilactobacillus mishanensis]